ncbi:hypothetical protein Nhal_2222 [Nitrosococcus halophilus Nc 4]|uniref:Uncharacterized protein n=1 Tax=Nitrosococcus halophilus (strain Nc4) TaxID=472759 RepID=D5C590_NITHN|nr:hypothetical protein [Nitrosococcus halophilus]ADE15313.1 hypothetical protein Nhal_2222 [Nitrosococcus halophilus Nc 4]
MLISAEWLTGLVTAALIITSAAPLVLLVLLLRDWIKGQLW